MKNILLASTALVLSAGIAAADVATVGNGYMGILYDGDDAVFSSRLRIQFNASGETDTGLSFGGSIRADNAGGGAGKRAMTAGNIYISGSMWKLSMGDVGGAAEASVGDLAAVGYEGLGDHNELEYLANSDRTAALLTLTFGAASLYVSADQQDYNATAGDPLTLVDSDEALSVGVSYDAGIAVIGVGYEDSDIDKQTVASVSFDISGVATVKAAYGKFDIGNAEDDQFGVSVVAPVGPVSLSAYYRKDTWAQDNYGVGVAYDLGGGAAFKVGVAQIWNGDKVTPDTNSVADAGVTFSF